MLISQRQAISRLRVTGRSVDWCIATAKKLATTKDGERWKIREPELDAAIRAELNPRPQPAGVRGISQRKISRLREYA